MSYHESILEIAVIFFDITLSIYLISRRKVNHITGAFRRLAIAVTVADICDVLAIQTAEFGGTSLPLYAHHIFHILNILSSTYATYAYFSYVSAYVHGDVRNTGLGHLNRIIIAGQIGLVIQNLFTGTVYYYENGVYYHGPFFVICAVVVPVYFLLLATGYFATHKTSYSLKQTVAIVMATVIVIAIYSFQTFAGFRIAITFYAASIGLLILFFALETPEFEKLQETLEKLEEAGKDAQIARRHAEDADRAKAEFLSQMSHEIKTPINSILGFDNLILEKIGSEEGDVKRYAENIREAGDRLLAFFNNLLEISKMGAESIGAREMSQMSELMDMLKKRQEQEFYIPKTPGVTYLLVDDNSMNLELLSKLLERTEGKTEMATDGKQALQMLRERHFDLVIMDYMMPVMDGLEAMKAITAEKICPETPVIMLTAAGNLEEKRAEFQEAGFRGYLTKPVVAASLYGMIRDLLPDGMVSDSVSWGRKAYEENEVRIRAGEKTGKKPIQISFPMLDVQEGLTYCMDDVPFYLSQLRAFAESGKREELQGFFEQEDWDNYRISVHALKSTARTIGAGDLSEKARAQEMAVKDGRLEAAVTAHDGLVDDLKRLEDQLLTGLKEQEKEDGGEEEQNDTETTGNTGARKVSDLQLGVQIMTAMAATVDTKNVMNPGHSSRVARYAAKIGERLGMPENKQSILYAMGLVHDIGKIIIPDDILAKPDELTKEERDIVKMHPVIGYEILRDVTEMPGLCTGARWHHERYDGKGYPDGLKEKEIPLEARILAVADAFDAMTSPRAYAGTKPYAEARLDLTEHKGTQFDPDVVDALLFVMDEELQKQQRA